MSNAFKRADILVPDAEYMSKWAVIACDQYTSQPEYWKETETIVGESFSSLNLILPEIYLESDDVSKRIENIHKCMDFYLEKNIFTEYKNSMIYIERIQSNGVLREGIIGMIDLEEYDFRKGSTSSVRATESTVIERIPPRIKVRQGASLELPHIMILIDDADKTVIEPLGQKKSEFKKLYDIDLIQGGGKISGYLMTNEACENTEKALDILGSKDKFKEKYKTENVLLYAMGDGNHSLATAKQFYENLKKENPDKDLSNHPARYALVEIVNLHSTALKFEAIHRIVTDVNVDDFICEMNEKLALSSEHSEQKITLVTGDNEKIAYIHNRSSNLAVGSLQNFIDNYLNEHGGKVDYIHGTDTVKKLSASQNSIGFILEDMDKKDLFPTVISDGSLPRKTFSMGLANDKRFYIECRKIKI
ncbi:MAG: DUF1015 domain-containing protein [Porcipelethomonas sp.]